MTHLLRVLYRPHWSVNDRLNYSTQTKKTAGWDADRNAGLAVMETSLRPSLLDIRRRLERSDSEGVEGYRVPTDDHRPDDGTRTRSSSVAFRGVIAEMVHGLFETPGPHGG